MCRSQTARFSAKLISRQVTIADSFITEEGADVGVDNKTAVSSDYEPASSKFTGQIESVTIALSPSKLTAVDQKAIDDAGEAADKADEQTASGVSRVANLRSTHALHFLTR